VVHSSSFLASEQFLQSLVTPFVLRQQRQNVVAVISKKGVKSMEQESFDKDYLRDLPADNGGFGIATGAGRARQPGRDLTLCSGEATKVPGGRMVRAIYCKCREIPS
jgi:hypothetical protein